MKDTLRPENQLIWDLLSPQTRTSDSLVQQHQSTVIKAANKLIHLLDKVEKFGSVSGEESIQIQKSQIIEIVDICMDSLGLMAQFNKMTNLKRKENHRFDLSHEFHHLSSPSVPFTDQLYGDDVPKSIKEIQDVNRVGKRIGRAINRGRGFSAFSGVSRGGTFRGRGSFRGCGSFRARASYGYRPRNEGNSNLSQSKN
ncbi:hypothetical protein SNE40_023741 [Patella caerulea]|uniref:Uncharacterized protein n=1 Tax=Patella caerulea TaxID=87958 RepID=A0AAN8FZP4_PATCE